MVIREKQKDYSSHRDSTIEFADNIFKNCVEECLRYWNVEVSTSQGENIDKLFLNLTKNNLIMEKLIEVVKDFVSLPESEVEDRLEALSIISSLIIDAITQVHNYRNSYFEKFGLQSLRKDWWLHNPNF